MASPNQTTARSAVLPPRPVSPEPWLVRAAAGWLQAGHMSHLGLGNTMRLANAYNRMKFSSRDRWRRSMYEQHLDALLQENGGLARPAIEMQDGFVIDRSLTLPHLDRILADAEEIIAERSGQRLIATADGT